MARVTFITAHGNPLLVRLRRLAGQPDAYRKQGKVWLQGEHLCEAYLARCPAAGVQAVIGESGWAAPHLRQIASRAEAVAVVPDALMTGLGTLETPVPLAFAVDWPGSGTVRPGVATLVLDRLQDAGNVGTLLRSAAGFGFAQVLALKGTAALWSPKVLRAGMGAHFTLGLVEGAAPADIAALGVPLLGTSSHAAAALHDAALSWPCAWALGNEGQGLAEAVLELCRLVVRIPQPGGGESLNVGVAGAVCMYESARRRLLG